MNISEKIEAIRQEPQHVRMRWVWGCVTVSMLMILIIWFFSLATLFKKENASTEDEKASLGEQLKNINKQAPSLKDYTPGQQDFAGEEGISSDKSAAATNINNDQNDFQYPIQDSTPEIPSSAAYNPQQ